METKDRQSGSADHDDVDGELARYMQMASLLADEESGSGGEHDRDPFDERDDDNLVAFDSSGLGRAEFEDANSLIARQLLCPTDSPDRSDFHALRFEGSRMQKILDQHVASSQDTRAQNRRNYVDKQQLMSKRY